MEHSQCRAFEIMKFWRVIDKRAKLDSFHAFLMSFLRELFHRKVLSLTFHKIPKRTLFFEFQSIKFRNDLRVPMLRGSLCNVHVACEVVWTRLLCTDDQTSYR